MPEITDQTVAKIARLANLELGPEETVRFAGQLEKIIDYIHKLKQLDTANIPQTTHAMLIQNIWREDKVVPGLRQEEALAEAPDTEDKGFRVPRIIE